MAWKISVTKLCFYKTVLVIWRWDLLQYCFSSCFSLCPLIHQDSRIFTVISNFCSWTKQIAFEFSLDVFCGIWYCLPFPLIKMASVVFMTVYLYLWFSSFPSGCAYYLRRSCCVLQLSFFGSLFILCVLSDLIQPHGFCEWLCTVDFRTFCL